MRAARHSWPAAGSQPVDAVMAKPLAASTVSGSRIFMYQGGSRPRLAQERSTKYTAASSVAWQGRRERTRRFGTAGGGLIVEGKRQFG